LIGAPDGLVNTSADENLPQLSEDGSRLLFLRDGVPHLVDLHAARDITPPALLRQHPRGGAGLSPDGTQVVVAANSLPRQRGTNETGVPSARVFDVTTGAARSYFGKKTYVADGDASFTFRPVVGNGRTPFIGLEAGGIDAFCERTIYLPFPIPIDGFDSHGPASYGQIIHGSQASEDGLSGEHCGNNGVIDVGFPYVGDFAVSSANTIAFAADDDIGVLSPAEGDDWTHMTLEWLNHGRRFRHTPTGINSTLIERSPSFANHGRFLGYIRTVRGRDGDPIRQYAEVYDGYAGRRLHLGAHTDGYRFSTSATRLSIAQDATRDVYADIHRDSQAGPFIPDRPDRAS
jgi:hypothetical protein